MFNNAAIVPRAAAAFLGFIAVAVAEDPVFREHIIERNSPLVDHAVMSVTLSDLDNDGDLDWTVGTIWPQVREKHQARTLFWYENKDLQTWVRHRIGRDPEMYGGACSLDINADGNRDVVATNLWLNQGQGHRWEFVRTGIGDGAHDLQAADFNQDGRQDVLAFTQDGGLNWFEAGEDLSERWIKHAIAAPRYAGGKVHACGSPKAAADIDGDQDIDVAGVAGWFENLDGRGREWKYRRHGLFPSTKAGGETAFPWGFAVKTVIKDIDGDGDADIVQSECDTKDPAGIAWLENTDGKGSFKLQWIKTRVREDFHTLRVFDYDLDGDLDVFSGVGPLADPSAPKRAYLFEQRREPDRNRLTWKEHVLFEGMTIHEGASGDVDNDGDTDIMLKPWNRFDQRQDFVLLENLCITPGRDAHQD